MDTVLSCGSCAFCINEGKPNFYTDGNFYYDGFCCHPWVEDFVYFDEEACSYFVRSLNS